MRGTGVSLNRSIGNITTEQAIADYESFAMFYSRQHRSLVALAYAASGNRAWAEDVAHDALVATYKDWERIQSLSNPDAWVRRILLNQATSAYRRRVAEAKAISKLGTRSSSSSFREVPDDIDAIWKEVRRLSKRQVQVITLRYLEDLTFSEIAEVLGCSKEAVNIHFRRARRILARRLGIREDQ